MKRWGYIAIFGCFLLIAGFSASADRLPNQTPENQMIHMTTVIDVVGFVSESTQMSWAIASPGSIPTGILGPSQSIGLVDYGRSMMTNGGHYMENSEFTFDSRDKSSGANNLNTESVVTYDSVEGSFLAGEEYLSLDVAGNFSDAANSVRCVFMQGSSSVIPAFCNKVTAKSQLINVNHAQIATKGGIRAVAATADVPAALNYRISVTPDANSESGYADGSVRTTFSAGIMEARDNSTANWNKAATTNTWTDSTFVSGGIKNFQKDFSYGSGIKL